MSQQITIFIRLADGTMRQQSVSLGTYFVGNDPGCHFVIEGSGISRWHARLKLEVDELTVTNLDGTSGTKVRGAPLKEERSFVYPQTLEMGDAVLTIEQGDLFSVKIQKPSARPAYRPAEDDLLQSVQIRRVDGAVAVPTPRPDSFPLPKTEMPLREPPKPETPQERRQKFVAGLPRLFAAEPDVKKVCPQILRGLMEQVPDAARGALFIIDPPTGKLALRAGIPEHNPPVSRAHIQRVAEEQKGFVWREEKDGPSTSGGTGHSGVHVPLVHEGSTVGVLVVDNEAHHGSFGSADLDFLTRVARQLSPLVVRQVG